MWMMTHEDMLDLGLVKITPTDDETDYLLAQRAAAIEYLGRNWRGRADCEHAYCSPDETRVITTRV